MPKQDLKRLEQKEKEKQEKDKQKDQQAAKQPPTKAEAIKKWKGKDWFSILSPKSFGETFLYETPATDPSSIVGRPVEVFAPQLTGDKTRSHIKLLFMVDEVKEKSATTQFYGLECLPEYVYRNIRAGLQKLEAIDTVDTKDN